MHKKNHKHKSNHTNEVHAPRRRKKVSLFYKLSFSTTLTLAIALFYFLVLVASAPRSIPYVTTKVEEVLKSNFSPESSAREVKVSFTKYGTLKIAISDLKIFYQENAGDKQQFYIPTFESEFSLFKILFGKFRPKSIRIADSEFLIKQKNTDTSNTPNNDLSFIFKALNSLREKDFPVKNLKIENSKIVFDDKKFFIKEINIQNSWKDSGLEISALSRINLMEKKKDILLKANCFFSEESDLKCNLLSENLTTDMLTDIHPALSHIEKIDTSLNLFVSFNFSEEKFSNIAFRINANKGSFSFLNFFQERVFFDNFAIAGEFDNKAGILNLSKIESDLTSEMAVKPHLSMSLAISDINQDNTKFDFNINLSNVENNRVEKLWPVTIEKDNKIRSWVLTHVKNGMISSANANFILLKKSQEFHLDKIDSKLTFSDFDLSYDEHFPMIGKISGTADFTKQGMEINITSGDVLETKISQAKISIEDFSAKTALLKINGKSSGAAADSIKHADYKSEFANEIVKYLNGTAQNEFDVRVPLENNINLKDVYIAVNSVAQNVKNDYVTGNVVINVKKDSHNDNFISSLDFTGAELHAKDFDIAKETAVSGGLDFNLSLIGDKLLIKNISLWKKNNQKIAKIYGKLGFNLKPFAPYLVDIKNHNFGKSDYEISYLVDAKAFKRQLNIKGKYLNIKPFIEKKSSSSPASKTHFIDSRIQVVLSDLEMANGKKISNFYFYLDCKSGFCYDGILKGSYEKNKAISLKLVGVDSQTAELTGTANDVGHLAEALGISNLVAAGDMKFKLENKLREGQQNLQGQVTVSNGMTVYENETVKKLAKNDLFSKIKDTIFSNEKTTFDSVKLDLSFYQNILEIKSLIANNYKIGITAKGAIDIGKNTINIKGMIVPGFIVNNLFGIGNIPLIGNVISGLLTGGEGGGLFGIRYEYVKKEGEAEGNFTTNKVSSFLPTTLQNLLDAI